MKHPLASFHLPYICIALLIFQSCAHITPLGGGTKDNDPPKVIKSVPKQKEVKVVGKNIEIEFDEYIVLKDVPNQVSVIPTLNEAPEISAKGKKVSIVLKGGLESNTTYTIRFGNAITDLHDGNALQNFEYCFSTGDHIDSAFVAGRVTDAFSKSAARDTWVYLYKENDDSIVYKTKPHYFSKCDEDGNYSISNVKPGDYKIIALNDKNKNFTYEQGEESIGFLKERIQVRGDSGRTNLFTFKEEPSRLFVKKIVQPHFGKAIIILSKDVLGPQLIPYNSAAKLGSKDKINFGTNDSLILWYKNSVDDTLKYILADQNKVIDTISIISSNQKKQEKEIASGKFKVAIEKLASQFPEKKEMMLVFTQPIMIMDTSKIIFTKSKATRLTAQFLANEALSEHPKLRSGSGYFTNWTVVSALDFESTYELMLLPGAVKNYFEVINDTIKLSFTTSPRENYGKLQITISMSLVDSSEYIFQLFDSKMHLSHESKLIFMNNNAVVNIPYLLGDNYNTRLIIDANRDHKFTSGNFLNQILPEKIIDGTQQIKILADWDTENKWEIAR